MNLPLAARKQALIACLNALNKDALVEELLPDLEALLLPGMHASLSDWAYEQYMQGQMDIKASRFVSEEEIRVKLQKTLERIRQREASEGVIAAKAA